MWRILGRTFGPHYTNNSILYENYARSKTSTIMSYVWPALMTYACLRELHENLVSWMLLTLVDVSKIPDRWWSYVCVNDICLAVIITIYLWTFTVCWDLMVVCTYMLRWTLELIVTRAKCTKFILKCHRFMNVMKSFFFSNKWWVFNQLIFKKKLIDMWTK